MNHGLVIILVSIISALLFQISITDSFGQGLPNIDTSIIDKTNELMDKSEKVLEKTGEVMEKGSEIATQAEGISKNVGGCLIVTATYGSEMAPQVQFLREIRDNTVLSTQSGASFMGAFNAFYYSFSPTVADMERQNPMFKEMVKATITPLLSSLALLQYTDIDTEEEMLGYGIGIILLNIGMYFVAPAVIVYKIKNRRK